MADENGDESPDEGYVFVFDRRNVDGKSVKIPLGGLFDYSLFKTRVLEVCAKLLFHTYLRRKKCICFFWMSARFCKSCN